MIWGRKLPTPGPQWRKLFPCHISTDGLHGPSSMTSFIPDFLRPHCMANPGLPCPSSQQPVQPGLALSVPLVENFLVYPQLQKTAGCWLAQAHLTSSFPLLVVLSQGMSQSLNPLWYRGIGCEPLPLTGRVPCSLETSALSCPSRHRCMF